MIHVDNDGEYGSRPAGWPSVEAIKVALCDATENPTTDNLAVILATYYEDNLHRPDPDPDSEDLGWGDWVMEKSDEALDSIARAVLALFKPDATQASTCPWCHESDPAVRGRVAAPEFAQECGDHSPSVCWNDFHGRDAAQADPATGPRYAPCPTVDAVVAAACALRDQDSACVDDDETDESYTYEVQVEWERRLTDLYAKVDWMLADDAALAREEDHA